MPNSLDFGRWLQRLGFKVGEEPPIIRTVQPVAIVADHRQLVSHPLGPSGAVGFSAPGGAATAPAIEVITSVPLWVDFGVSVPATAEFALRIGLGIPPVLTAPTNCVVQAFEPGSVSNWRFGTVIPPGTQTEPSWRTATGDLVKIPRIFVPAGGWALLYRATVGVNTMAVVAVYYELPNLFAP